MAITFEKAFGLHPTALSVRAHRAEILASNLANSDTPGYKARDIDFEAILRQQAGTYENKNPPLPMAATNEHHLPPLKTDGAVDDLLYRIPEAPALDGNTVETDEEQARFAENSLAYEASLRFINGRIKGLMTAITGQ
jgi:flagellar basal-body rod protein FlgB